MRHSQVAVFLTAYRSLRRLSADDASGAGGPTTWPSVLMSQRFEQLQAAYDLLPPSLRQNTWMLTSVERAA
jgi:hypothetical protein